MIFRILLQFFYPFVLSLSKHEWMKNQMFRVFILQQAQDERILTPNVHLSKDSIKYFLILKLSRAPYFGIVREFHPDCPGTGSAK
jgi:hypothetical protein